MAALDWLLRLLVFNRRLPRVGMGFLDVAYGPHEKQRMDVLIPLGAGPFPVLIYVHGGGWVTGDKASYHWTTHSFAEAGLLVFSVNYRWAPEASFPEQVQDIAAAIEWARQSAVVYHGRNDQVFMAGDSAGAHLVCWLHMALCQPELLASVGLKAPLPGSALLGSLLYYGIYDLATAWNVGAVIRPPIRALLGTKPKEAPELFALASPSRHVAKAAAPLFVCVGEKDLLYGQTLALLQALEKQGAPHERLLLSRRQYPDAGHSFINFGARKAAQVALGKSLDFIRRARPGLAPDQRDRS